MKLLNKAGEMPSLEPPEDESIRTLYVGGLDARITEQDLRDQFYAHGEIESVKMVLQRACAFVTYTTREGAEKAAEELANKLVIKGLRLKLLWGRPQAPKPESDASDEARQQAAVAHSGLLPRAVISQQHNQPLHPPGTQDQPPAMPYFNIPPPIPQQERTYYPSMDPQRMGALVPSQEGSSSGSSGTSEDRSGSEKQQQGQHFPYPPPMRPPQGQFYQSYYPPPYGYMPPPPGPPPYQQYPPYQSSMAPPPSISEQPLYPQRPPPGPNQQYPPYQHRMPPPPSGGGEQSAYQQNTAQGMDRQHPPYQASVPPPSSSGEQPENQQKPQSGTDQQS